MPSHWRFLELSLPTDDVAESLAFYRALGFTELLTGDIRRHPYAAVTDGRIALGLHGGQLEAPALSFVQAGTARWAGQLAAAGFELAFQRLGVEDFHECGLMAPGGGLVVLMEAPTFSGQQLGDVPAPLPGRSRHIGLGGPATPDCEDFWALAGLAADPDDPAEGLVLAGPGLRLCIGGPPGGGPTLHFTPEAMAGVLDGLEQRHITARRRGHQWVITAPEGTALVLSQRPAGTSAPDTGPQ